MLIWHGGLPRSGKSYEAVARRLIGAVQKGRPVDAFIDGLNFERIAEVSGVSLERLRELLHVLTEPDLAVIWERTRDNALVIIDEAQDHWPNRATMSKPMTKFVTQHGHRGQDILLMGQDYHDVHVLFRRRIELRFEFLKLSAVGAEHRYSVTTFRHRGGDDEPVLVGTEQCKYDPKFFGLYASHVSSDIQTENYKDARAGMWAQPVIKYGVPVAFVGILFGGWYLVRFFKGETFAPSAAVAASAPHPSPAPVVRPGALVASPTASPAAAPADPARLPQEVFVRDLDARGRIRLAALLEMHDRRNGLIEWVAGDARVIHRASLDELRDLGFAVVVGLRSVQLGFGSWSSIAVMWPIESDARVSDERQQVIRGGSSVPPLATEVPAGPSMGSLGGGKPPAPPPEVDAPGESAKRPPRRA